MLEDKRTVFDSGQHFLRKVTNKGVYSSCEITHGALNHVFCPKLETSSELFTFMKRDKLSKCKYANFHELVPLYEWADRKKVQKLQAKLTMFKAEHKREQF